MATPEIEMTSKLASEKEHDGGEGGSSGAFASKVITSNSSRMLRRNSIASKNWTSAQQKLTLDDGRKVDVVASDAEAAGVDPKKAVNLVLCTTRFATGMCVIIVIIKGYVYWSSAGGAKKTMKTSLLDSIGDLLANFVSAYTSGRMSRVDRKNYPVGQTKFESLGCLVFSTLMFTMMFCNILENGEKLLGGSEDDDGDDADLWFQTKALGCTSTYKLCLFLFCRLYAIPQTGSQILVALAADKRNDWITTWSSLLCLNAADFFGVPGPIDVYVSLILSSVIMAIWCQMLFEHLAILSQVTADGEFRSIVFEVVECALRAPCTVYFEDVVAFLSSGSLHIVEVCITVTGDASFNVVNEVQCNVEKSVLALEGVERVIITTKVEDP